jgi:hypothetical protein
LMLCACSVHVSFLLESVREDMKVGWDLFGSISCVILGGLIV